MHVSVSSLESSIVHSLVLISSTLEVWIYVGQVLPLGLSHENRVLTIDAYQIQPLGQVTHAYYEPLYVSPYCHECQLQK